AFIGVSGASNFAADGHSYKIIDVENMQIIQSIATDGYVQTSALLSTAYEKETGKVYVYITYNKQPGGIDVIEFDMKTKEGTSNPLFVPGADLSQYCICSLVCDRDGTIYYKNDSCNLMAIKNINPKITEPEEKPTDGGNKGGGSSSGGSSGGGSSSVSVSSSKDVNVSVSKDDTTKGNVASAAITGTEKTQNGSTSVSVSSDTISKAVKEAVAAVKEQISKDAIPEVAVDVKGDSTTSDIDVKVPTAAVKEIVKNDDVQLKIDSSIGTIILDNKALSVIADNTAGSDISITIEKKEMENRPAFELNISTAANSYVSHFGKGTVQVSLPYTLRNGETAAGLIVRYVDKDGAKTDMPTSYDAKNNKVSFTTNHFSSYMIDYDADLAKKAVNFSDVKDTDWFAESVKNL
ncbi:MAG: hypothetical protein ACI4LO_08505, partial [Anaerovoracaceae bacterium]